MGEGVIRYCESSVPLLLPQAHFSGVTGGTVTTLVKSPCRGKPACTWLLLDRRSFGNPIPVPCLPKSPLCSGVVVFAWMHRDTDPWEEKLAWWLTLSKVTATFGDSRRLVIFVTFWSKNKSFFVFDPCVSYLLSCCTLKQIRYEIPLRTPQLNSNKFATSQYHRTWT